MTAARTSAFRTLGTGSLATSQPPVSRPDYCDGGMDTAPIHKSTLRIYP